MEDMFETSLSCTRHYYLTWYDKYVRAHGRLPEPHWAREPVPRYNATHDEYVKARRLAKKR